jgi:hypothetical protein
MVHSNPQYRGLIPQKPKWKSGETTMLRVPKVLKEKIIAIVYQLDEQWARQQEEKSE